MNGWKVEQLAELLRNPWFGVVLQNVTRPSGVTEKYYVIDFPGPAVGVVARRGDEFLFIEQYRHIVGEHVWAIPSGGVAAGEDPASAAARELEEETGYRPSKPLEKIVSYYPSYGCSNQRFELFLAEEPVLASDGFDANEVISRRWIHKRDVLAMIARNEIVDGLSLTPLLMVLLNDATR